MRYFYIFILTLILISCNEKKGYSFSLGIRTSNVSDSECMEAIKNGTIISSISVIGEEIAGSKHTLGVNRVLYNDFIYYVSFSFAQPNYSTNLQYMVCENKTELSNE